MNMLKRIATLMLMSFLASCGGGGGDAGTSPFTTTTGGGPAPTASAATTVDVLASAVQVGSGGDQVTISAVVKGAGNVSLAAAPVTFSTDSGTLSSVSGVTDAAGVATAVLTAGADKSNRSLTVTVNSGAVAGSIVLPVAGTTLSYSGATTVTLGSQTIVAIKATDSKGVAIPSLPVAVTSSLNNGLSASAISTDAQGNATVNYTATTAGADTVTFSGAGATATASIQISGENFVFTSPAPGTRIPVGTPAQLTIRYLSGGVPQSGKTVVFAVTAGTVTPSAITDSTGSATVTVVSNTASPATVQATLTGSSVAAQATLPIVFIAQNPANLVLQVSPTAIGPNPGTSTAQQAQVLATVTDTVGNPVSGVTVDFNRVADPSGGNLSQASAVTDNSGQASVQYIAGALTTANDGVQLRATVSGTSVTNATLATLTVNQSALFIALGTGNTITNLDPQTYQKDWVVYVTDANGIAVPNINVTIAVLPVEYGKGDLTFVGTAWTYSSNVVFCPNEDVNFNGTLNSGEDANGDGVLQPGNVISVTTAATGSAASTGTVRTDTTGRATISLIYAESYAPWVRVRLQAKAVVSGTESVKEAIFIVTGAASDFTSASNPPAGVESPFGINACAVPN